LPAELVVLRPSVCWYTTTELTIMTVLTRLAGSATRSWQVPGHPEVG
jgi:hypothetical protein